MKTKIDTQAEWKRVFRFLPVTTEDGYKVTFGYVWQRKVEWQLSWKTEYHTNPDGKETAYRESQEVYGYGSNPPPPDTRPNRPPPPPCPPRKFSGSGNRNIALGHVMLNREETGRTATVCPECGTIDCYKGPAKFDISGAGVMHAKSSDIMQSCKTRQQLRALKKINIRKKLRTRTGSTGPR